MFNLMIVDDENIITDSLYELFSDESSLELNIFKAYSGKEAIDKMYSTKLDILVIDICMPDMNGLDVQKKVVNQWPHCKVIILTGHADFEFVKTSIRSGSLDYVLKTEDDEVLKEKPKSL